MLLNNRASAWFLPCFSALQHCLKPDFPRLLATRILARLLKNARRRSMGEWSKYEKNRGDHQTVQAG
jgi:hypothetical protein